MHYIVPWSSNANVLLKMAHHSTIIKLTVTLSPQVNPQSVHLMLTKDSCSDFFTYGIALNSFSVGD